MLFKTITLAALLGMAAAKPGKKAKKTCFIADGGDDFASAIVYDSGYVEILVEVYNELSTGVTEHNYHLHVGWDKDSEECGADYTGGHYDPTRACGGASDAPCLDGLGIRVKGYAYDGSAPATAVCGTDGWLQDNCEVGDLSGRSGKVEVGGEPTLTEFWFPEFLNHFEEDNELEEDESSNRIREPAKWSSIVFHCDGNPDCKARVACAKYEKIKCSDLFVLDGP